MFIEKLVAMLVGYGLAKLGGEGFGGIFDLFIPKTTASPGGQASPIIPTGIVPATFVPQGSHPTHVPPGSIPSVSPSAIPVSEVAPGGLPPFPGPGWVFAKPNAAIVQRAWTLLPLLQLGQHKFETAPGQSDKWLAYRKEKHAAGKTGVTVYTPKALAQPQSFPGAGPTVTHSPPVGPAPGNFPQGVLTSTPVGPTVGPSNPAPMQPAPGQLFPTLRLGSRGTSVTTWQKAIGVPADGAFGRQTQSATIMWQRAHGLTPDGVVGPRTWATLGVAA